MVELLDCPHEIVRYVLSNLELTDVKNARLACKTLEVIGAETLLPTIHVVFTKQSIERLRDVSLHPVISLYVNEIIYEADRVDHYDQQEDWERDAVDSEYLTSQSPESVEELQLMLPGDPMKAYHRYSRKKLDSGWKKYQALHKEQLVSTLVFSPCSPPSNFSLEDSACEAALVAISVSTVGKARKEIGYQRSTARQWPHRSPGKRQASCRWVLFSVRRPKAYP